MASQDRGPEFTFTAADALRLYEEAIDVNGKVAQAETAQCLAKIKAAAENGERACYIDPPYKYRDLVIRRLQSLGFTVKVFDDQRDQTSTTTVSW